jgi:hypothetical protein
MLRRLQYLALTLALAACQPTPIAGVAVDTLPGQALPQAPLPGGDQASVFRTVTIPSGGSIRLAFWANTHPDCTNAGYFTIREQGPPRHGKLEITETEDFGHWPEKNPRSACNTRRVDGVLVQYKSKPGFVGVDHATYDVFFPYSGMRRVNLTVNVM